MKGVPGTFSQIYIQVVLVVKWRAQLIDESWEAELHKYITGIIKGKEQILIAINGMPDHVHILIRLSPACRLSDLMREVKKASNVWVNSSGLCKTKFQWQTGYGAFSYSKSAIDNVIRYIERQKEHHAKKSLEKEYKKFLKDFDVDYKEEYLFDRR